MSDLIVPGDILHPEHRDQPNPEFLGWFQGRRYQTIISDNPWWYADQRKVKKDGVTPTRGIGACHHYGQIKTDVLCKLPIGELADERCHLYLWSTAPLLDEALLVMDAWGFKYSTIMFTWVKLNPGRFPKVQALFRKLVGIIPRTRQLRFPWKDPLELLNHLRVFNPGYYTGSNVELVLLGIKRKEGSKSTTKPFRHAKGCKSSQVVFHPRMEHSAKPDEVQDRIEYMYPHVVPRLELFARRPKEGWDVFGDEL